MVDKDHQYPDLKVMAELWSSTLLLYPHFCTPNPELWWIHVDHSQIYVYIYTSIYVHTFGYTLTYRSSTIHFPSSRPPTGHVDVQRPAAKEGAPQDQALHLRLRALWALRRRRWMPWSHGENRGTATKRPVASWVFSSIYKAIMSIMSQNLCETSRNTPNCEFAKQC